MNKYISITIICVGMIIMIECIENQKGSDGFKTIPDTIKNINLTMNESNYTIPISNVMNQINNTKEYMETEWCKFGYKLTINGRTYNISGISIYKNMELCKAEIIYPNGSVARYFSKDGNYLSIFRITSLK